MKMLIKKLLTRLAKAIKLKGKEVLKEKLKDGIKFLFEWLWELFINMF